MPIRFVSSLEDLELYIYIGGKLIFRSLRYMEVTGFYDNKEECIKDIVIKLENGGHIHTLCGTQRLRRSERALITISRLDGVNVRLHVHSLDKCPHGYASLNIYNLIDSTLYVPLFVRDKLVTRDLSYGKCMPYKLPLGSNTFKINARGTSFDLPTPPSRSDVHIFLTGDEDIVRISHIVDDADEDCNRIDINDLAREWYVSIHMNIDNVIFPSGMKISFSILHDGIRVIGGADVIIRYERIRNLWIDDIPFIIHLICDKFAIIGTRNRHRLLALTRDPIDDELFEKISSYLRKLGYLFK